VSTTYLLTVETGFNMKEAILFISISFWFQKAPAQLDSTCNCPVEKGRFVFERNPDKEWGTVIYQVSIKSKHTRVYSCLSGLVTAQYSIANDRLVVGIQSSEYVFIYDNLKSADSLVGQRIEKGQLIGYINKGEMLLVRVKKDSEYIDPQKIIRCRNKNMF
jgi:hypothetical protein